MTFVENSGEFGGAIYNNAFEGEANPTYEQCIFHRNKGLNTTGAVYSRTGNNGISNPSFTDCSFIENTSNGDGGAVFNSGNAGQMLSSFTRCTFTQNTANNSGGAVYNNGFQGQSNYNFASCTFTSNYAGNSGGALYNNGFRGISDGLVSSSTFTTNRTNTNDGGAIYNGGGGISTENGQARLTATNTRFTQNTGGRSAGGVYFFADFGDVTSQLTNCIFDRNDQHIGYDDGNTNTQPTFTNCTFTGATSAAVNIRFWDSGQTPLDFVNCIFWDNTTMKVGAGTGTLNVIYSIIEDNTYAGTGTLFNQDPLFTDAASGTFTLQAGSPAIDEGNNADIPTGVTTDFAGDQRIQSGTVDMGAFEFSPQSEFYVKAMGGNDANSGEDFGNAFATFQKALEEAEAFGTGAKIYVAAGTYTPTQSYNLFTGAEIATGSVTRTASFKIPDGVEVYGGFSGNESGAITQSILDARDFITNETVLSGDIDGMPDQVTGSGATLSITGNGSNAYHVIFTFEVSPSTIMDGFTISGGSANDTSNTYESRGGGWFNISSFSSYFNNELSSPTIRNCTFKNNNARVRGAAFFSQLNASPTFTNCTFLDNKGEGSSTGVFTSESANTGIEYKFINCVFDNSNIAGNLGNVSVVNTIFTNNLIPAISQFSSMNTTIRNSIFWQNSSSWDVSGGGVDVAHTLVQEIDETTITSGSYAGTTVGAGMIYAQDPLFTDAANGDLTLQPCSPAIDAGSSVSVTKATDIAGNVRIQGAAVDMGAYESTPTPLPELNFTVTQTDFGGQTAGSSTTLSYTITNSGSATLNLAGITSDNSPVFEVQNIPTMISVGASASFDVVFTPNTGGVSTAEITITSNDCDPTLSFSVSGTATSPARDFYVKASGGNDSNGGTSFSDAYATLQKALEEAEATEAGSKIYVAAGTYKPTHRYNASTGMSLGVGSGTDRDQVFRILSATSIYGGFAASSLGTVTQADIDNRDFTTNETILSGDFNGDDMLVGTGASLTISQNTENAYHVLLTYNVSATTLIDGFTVRGGYADGFSFPAMHGGGLINQADNDFSSRIFSSPTIKNCYFVANQARLNGGGIYSFADGSFGAQTTVSANPTIIDTRFQQNKSGERGGGIFNYCLNSGGEANLSLTRVTFTGNYAELTGGGLQNRTLTNGNVHTTLLACTFLENETNSGGGA
ncbi:MAG: choice-of-anchor Q domain-containing protein [Bacteroidota bacterium]